MTTVEPEPKSSETERKSYASGHNLLKNRAISGFIKSRWYPGIFQWPTALVFLFIIYLFFFGPNLAHSNFGTALTWVLWWPLIPIIFILLGRFWCTICPFGSLNDVVQKFVGHNRPVPRFLKNYGIWIIDAVFILVTWGDHIFGMVEFPWVSGVIMLGIGTAVVASGALWERRTWCRYLCFLGGLSSNYSQTSVLALRGTPTTCAGCKVSACYKGNEKVPGCPVFEFPRVMDSNAQCNLCGYCVKTCPNDSLTLKARIPTRELWSVRKPQFAAAFLAAVIMGIVFIQNITMLEIWQPILNEIGNILHTSNFNVTFTVAFLIFISVPLLLLGITSSIAKKANRASVVQNFAKFGYAIIALDVAGHIAHNLFHLLAEGGSVLITGAAFFGMDLHDASPALLGSTTIQMLQYGLIVLGTVGSLYTAYRISRSNFADNMWSTTVPYWVLILFFGAINIVLFSLPMAMRM
ncbi:MAG: ferredoxin [Dehalococcoidales bacterium]|nr:ferredoxin [Dehalococcoidales bacterium]